MIQQLSNGENNNHHRQLHSSQFPWFSAQILLIIFLGGSHRLHNTTQVYRLWPPSIAPLPELFAQLITSMEYAAMWCTQLVVFIHMNNHTIKSPLQSILQAVFKNPKYHKPCNTCRSVQCHPTNSREHSIFQSKNYWEWLQLDWSTLVARSATAVGFQNADLSLWTFSISTFLAKHRRSH